MTRLVTLLTDFGTADGYVGELKGVLATSAPCIWWSWILRSAARAPR
jgi:S-adenosylmethionine hydrolase